MLCGCPDFCIPLLGYQPSSILPRLGSPWPSSKNKYVSQRALSHLHKSSTNKYCLFFFGFYHSVRRSPLFKGDHTLLQCPAKQPMTSSQTRPLWASPACRKSGLGNLGWTTRPGLQQLQSCRRRCTGTGVVFAALSAANPRAGFPLCYPVAFLCGEQEGKREAGENERQSCDGVCKWAHMNMIRFDVHNVFQAKYRVSYQHILVSLSESRTYHTGRK